LHVHGDLECAGALSFITHMLACVINGTLSTSCNLLECGAAVK